MQNLLYIPSLHRPFNQQLKTARWVCDFVMSSKVKLVGSHFNVKFYIYLIKSLNKEYKKKQLEEYNGLPSESAVFAAYEFLNGKSESDLIKEIPLIINNRVSSLDRQIYSTYKAASYFINLAKDKFKLIDNKNRLTPNGKKLLSFRSPSFKLSLKEKEFFFERIIEVDFHFFISNCFFTKLRKKYKIKDLTKEQFDFLDKFYGIKHFNFTSSSLGNFNKVRNHWIEELEVLDTNGNIKRKYLKIISNLQFDLPFQELNQKLDLYEKENLKNKKKYIDRKGKFLKAYRNSFNSNLSDLGFINLYDMKEAMKMSYNNYQNFLQDFYENEKLNINIFFNNTVNSIDRRKRFYIRNIPVINIKIK